MKKSLKIICAFTALLYSNGYLIAEDFTEDTQQVVIDSVHEADYYETIAGRIAELMKDEPELFADFFALCNDPSHECVVEGACEKLVERQLMHVDGSIDDEIKVVTYAYFSMICEVMKEQGLLSIDQKTGMITVNGAVIEQN